MDPVKLSDAEYWCQLSSCTALLSLHCEIPMRDLRELNLNEGGRPVTRKPPSDAQIAAFQSHFGIVLPEDYIVFLRHSNGGHPERDAFRPKGLVDGLFGVAYFYRLNDDQADVSGVWAATTAWRNALSANVAAIGDDGGGNQILLCFDGNSASVKLCIHDEAMRLIHVADSFSEFIDMLREDPDMI